MASKLTSQQHWNRNHKASIAKSNHKYYVKTRKILNDKLRTRRKNYKKICLSYIRNYATKNDLKDVFKELTKRIFK